jgi:DNA-binding CsgD family transcriptional regulator
MNLGILIVDRRGTVHWKNRYAELTINESQHLGIVGGRVRCSNKDDHSRILQFLEGINSPRQRLLTTIGAPHCGAIQILAVLVRVEAAVSKAERAHSATIAIMLSDADRKVRLSPPDMRELFGLTPAEAALAAALGEGLTVQGYAERHGVSVGTARIQLKSIFSKTGATRQPELVRLLCTSIPARTLMGHPKLTEAIQALEVTPHADHPGSW